ncbi:MAG: T9SS type B sorting domain-containing protein [Bacteroidetes bacterium]|nr:T9SS type B sorting domain-containing protein [Bacteroidota bacterium]
MNAALLQRKPKMKQLVISLLAILGLSFFANVQIARATHVMGADITYKCIDTLKFEFTVKYYRSCQGVSFSNPSSETRVKCASGGSSASVSLSLQGIRDVTPVCATSGKPCNPKNTYGTGEGIEEHTYTTTIDFNKSPYSSLIGSGSSKCCQFIIETGQCCRNSDITTGAANQNFYTYAMIDICKAPCNSSPALTTEPIAFLCCNQPFYYNNGASDTSNFDSLSYSFSDPLKGQGSAIGYSGNYSKNKPFQVYDPTGKGVVNPNAATPIGLYLDPETGDLIFTPTKCDEKTVGVLEVKEWRKNKSGTYELIGITRRDMQFITKTCPGNNPPIINGPYSYNVCEGSQLCFTITTDDKVKVPAPPLPTPDPDTVTVKWNRGIPGASFTIPNPTALHQSGRFCWTPPAGTASDLPYSFTVTARDNACPLNAVTVRAFSVLVKPIAETERDVDTLECGKYTVTSVPTANFKTPAKYTWQVRDGKGALIIDRKIVYFKSNGSYISSKQHDTLQFRRGGTYIIQHTINNKSNCPNDYYDTLIVPPLLEVALALGNDTFVCAGQTLKLKANVLNGLFPIKYKWGTGDTTDYLDVRVPNWNPDTSFYVEITDKNKCTAWDSVTVFLRPNPIVKIGPDRRICDYDSITIIPNDSLAYWDDPRDTSEYRIRQGDSLIKEWYYKDALFSRDTNVTVFNEGWYSIKVIDSLGCFAEDSMYLDVNDHVEAKAGPDQVLCWNDLLILPAGGLDTATKTYQTGTYRWYDQSTAPPTYLGTMDTVSYNIKASTDFRLELYITEDTTTCFDDDTVKITVNPLPIVKMPGNMEICCDAGVVNLRLLEDPNAKGGVWSDKVNPTYVSSGYIFETALACAPATKTHKVSYKFIDAKTGCVKNDSFDIKVNPLPQVELRDGYFCQYKQVVYLKDDKIIKLPGNPDLGRQAFNCVDCKTYDPKKIIVDEGSGGPGAPQKFKLVIDEQTIPLGTKAADTIKIEFVYRSQFGCYNRDTSSIAITKVPKISFAGFPELCWDEGPVELKKLSNVTPVDGYWYAYDTMPGTYRPAKDLNQGLNNGALQEDTLNTLLTPEPTYPNAYTYYMRYYHDRSGCPIYKDTVLIINPLPKPNIIETPLQIVKNNPPYLFCENQDPIALSGIPAGGTWSAPYSGAMTSNTFNPKSSPTNTPFFITYDFVSIKGCRGQDSVEVQIEAKPKIDILNDDTAMCRVAGGMTLNIEAEYSNTNSITWVPLTKGTVDNPKSGKVKYTFTTNSDSVESLNLYVMTDPGNACPFTDDLYTVTVHPRPKADIVVDDPDGCNPHTGTITTQMLNTIDPTTATYEWTYSDGATDNLQNPSHQYTVNGTNTATLKLTSAFGCDTTLSLNVDVYPIPVAQFVPNPNNSTTAALPRFTFNNQSKVDDVLGAYIETNEWDFGDPTDLQDTSTKINPTFFYPSDTGSYTVTLKVTTNHGCTDQFTYPVIIGPDILVFIPNAFSPDGGGPQDNNGFKAIVNDGVQTYHMIIFNRWGERLFETTDRSLKWDGTYKGEPCQQDVYAYYLEVVSWSGEPYSYSGTVTLIR